ncbi:MAG: XdhC/CoxI family protein [Thiolinea sp.]
MISEDILAQALAWQQAGQHVALATVVRTWGSSPRPVGSHLAVNGQGEFAGSVSGGCIEGEVIRAAQQAMQDRQAQLLSFGVSNEQAWEVGLACGGQVDVQVMSLQQADWLAALQAERAARRGVGLQINLETGAVALLSSAASASPEILQRLQADQSGPLDSDTRLFLRVYTPPARLLIVGAVHIAQALVPMAATAGFEVTLIDPRRAFASAERFPAVRISHDWPDEALEALQVDATTAVVTLSHDPKLDDPALSVALNSPAFYIGALGSRRTHAQRLERLREEGFGEAALARIHAPVGLDLGGRLPAEIAVSILAQLLQVRYRNPS